jgi:release factor glutamine methyltransferase
VNGRFDSKISGDALGRWYGTAKIAATAAAVDRYELDWFLGELLDIDRLTLRLKSFPKVLPSAVSLAELETLWTKRLVDRIPVQYLVGHVHWRSFKLKVSPAVLIPRPETELLIDLVTKTETPPGVWVDLGTGSGAIALGLAQALPDAKIHATDISSAALEIARENAGQLGFAHRIQFHQGSWCEPIAHLQGQVSGFISNPPYIPRQIVTTLAPEVANHEPHLALDGGVDGLDDIQHLIDQGSRYLHSGGCWAVEFMAGQGEEITKRLESQGDYRDIRIAYDLSGWDRFAIARRK